MAIRPREGVREGDVFPPAWSVKPQKILNDSLEAILDNWKEQQKTCLAISWGGGGGGGGSWVSLGESWGGGGVELLLHPPP